MKLASYFESQNFKVAVRLVVKRTRIISLFVYAIAIVGFIILPREDISRSSYFDENALMSGLAKTLFGDAATVNKVATALRDRGQSGSILVIEEELSKLGLEVYQQNYSALPPIPLDHQSTPTISGRNIYGILRAPRASTTEAIILSAPFRTRDGTSNIYGIALMLSLANYFRTKNYWAKDLVFLVTSEGEIGMEAWMDAYLGQQSPAIIADPLQSHSGAIQAVFNLEVESSSLEYVEIIVGGTNGILPNLDMVNVITRLCMIEGIQTTYHAPLSPSFTYQQYLKAMLLFSARLAPGLPTGNHALFLRHRIDAITIRGVGKIPGQEKQNIVQLGRAMEGTIRSFNNLLETLHHSLYFYLLPSSSAFISIAFYCPPFGLFLLPLALEALKQWLLARTPDLICLTESPPTIPKEMPFQFNKTFVLLIICYVSGGLLCHLPALACAYLGPLTASGLMACLLSVCGASVVAPHLVGTSISDFEWRIVKCINLLLLIVMLAAFAILNFPLAVCLALCLSVPCTLAQPSGLSSPCAHRLTQIFLLLLSPPMWVWYFCTLHCYFLSGPTADVRGVVTDSITMVITGAASAYNSWHLFGCWLYWATCVCVWPLWMMAWCLSCQQVEVAPKDGGPANRSPGKGVTMDDGRREEGSSCSEDLESSSPVLTDQTSSPVLFPC